MLQTVELSKEEIQRYSPHLILPEVALAGQKQLKAASITIDTGFANLGFNLWEQQITSAWSLPTKRSYADKPMDTYRRQFDRSVGKVLLRLQRVDCALARW